MKKVLLLSIIIWEKFLKCRYSKNDEYIQHQHFQFHLYTRHSSKSHVCPAHVENSWYLLLQIEKLLSQGLDKEKRNEYLDRNWNVGVNASRGVTIHQTSCCCHFLGICLCCTPSSGIIKTIWSSIQVKFWAPILLLTAYVPAPVL